MKNPVEDMKHLLLVGDTWYVRAMVHGVIIKQTLRTSSLPVAQSRRDTILRGLWASADEKALLTQVQRQLVGIASEEDAEVRRVDKGLLLADAFTRWEKDPARAECNPRQVENHRYNWNAFMTWMHKGHPEIQYCRQVAPEIGREWAAHIYAKMRSTNTYNKYISTVHYVFRILAGYDAHIINPMTGVSKKAEKDGVSKEPFTDEELRVIFACLDDEFRLLAAIGLYMTLRLSDAATLRWDMFTPDLAYVDARHSKTGADASMRTPQPLRELLSRVPHGERTGYVLKTYSVMPRCSLVRSVQSQLQALGFQTRKEVTGLNGVRRVACIRGFHSFRHTAITMALAKGKSSAQVRRWAGHATEDMQRRYTHLDADIAGDAGDAIGKFW